MIPDAFDDAVRGLSSSGSRRAALAALLGAAMASLSPGDINASRFKVPRKKDKNRRDREGKKNRKKKKNDGKTSSGNGGCQNTFSEKEILNFIDKAAKKYGQSYSAMVRVARCESVLDPCAVNKSGPYYGLFQFLKSTWKTTPYGDKSIWDPEAQALAAAWMWKQGRKKEWACQ